MKIEHKVWNSARGSFRILF